MARDTPIPSEGSGSGGSSWEGEDDDLPADHLEHLADLDDRLGGHASGKAARPDGDTPAGDEPPEGLDAILLLRQMAAEDRGDDAGDDHEMPRRIGRFAVVREVGRGGFAVVYEAVDTRLLRRVALKVARPEAVLPRGARRRFVREAELAARLVHPNVVTIHEAGEADGRVFIAEEFCAGGNLGEWLERHPGPLPPRVAARVVLALAGAVAHSHGFCILHRDIKPANVLLVPGESGPLGDAAVGRLDVKLADFGLGKLADPEAVPGDASDLTRAGARLGTPAWMSPEQIDRSFGTVGPATDIHALGLLLDRLLTGRCAHAGGDDAETMRLVLTAEAVPADRVVRGVPADLGAVTAKCLAKRVVDRYATVADLAADLARFLDGRPTVARPVTAVAHALSFARRHRALAAASAVAVAATLVASVAVWLGNLERRHSALRTAEVRGHQAAATLRRGVESWRTGDVLAALGQLAACRTLDPPLAESLAGRWLRARLHGEEAILLAPDGSASAPLDLHAVAVSPDGRHVAVGGADGTLSLIPADGGVVERVRVHDEINDVAFSPDGDRIATAGEDGRVCVVDSRTGAMLSERQIDGGPLFAVAWTPFGRTLVCGGAARAVHVLDIDGADVPPVVLRPFDGRGAPPGNDADIECLVFVGRDRFAVACGNRVAIVDARSGDIIHDLPGHRGTVTHLAVSPDGRFLLAGGSDGQPRVWDASSGDLVAALPVLPSWMMGCAFSPDGARVVTGCRDGVVRVQPIAGGEAVSLVGHVDRVWDVAVLPGGAIVSSGADGTVRRWDPRRTLERSGVRVLAPVSGAVARAEPVGDSSLLVASRRTRALLRVGADGATVEDGQTPFPVSELTVGPGRDRAALSGPTYEIGTMSLPGSAPGPFHRLPDDIRSRAFVWSDRERLLVGDNTGRLVVWNDRTSRAEVIDAFGVNVDALACTSAGRPRLIVCVGKAVWLYDLSADGTPRSTARRLVELPVHNGTVRVAAWSPDGASFAIGTNTGEVERFDAHSGLPLGSFARHGREVIGLAWSPEGRTLLSADGECVRLSDVRTTTVFDELRPGFPIESMRLDVRGDEPVALVVAGNADEKDDDAGRIAIVDLGTGG